MALSPEEFLRTCKQERYQGSGPGGQKRNRVYSGIRLIHNPSQISAEAEAFRESQRNLQDSLHKLRMQLALLWPINFNEDDNDTEKLTIFSAPIFRIECSASHDDFPIFAMRSIYYLGKFLGQVSPAGQALACTSSALIRFLKKDKALWAKAQKIRAANSLHALK